MKKFEHKLLPCVFCIIGLNSYIVGHNLVQATLQKLFKNVDLEKLIDQASTQMTNASVKVEFEEKSHFA